MTRKNDMFTAEGKKRWRKGRRKKRMRRRKRGREKKIPENSCLIVYLNLTGLGHVTGVVLVP